MTNVDINSDDVMEPTIQYPENKEKLSEFLLKSPSELGYKSFNSNSTIKEPRCIRGMINGLINI